MTNTTIDPAANLCDNCMARFGFFTTAYLESSAGAAFAPEIIVSTLREALEERGDSCRASGHDR